MYEKYQINPLEQDQAMEDTTAINKPATTKVISSSTGSKYDVPVDMSLKTLGFLTTNIMSGNTAIDDNAQQAVLDAFNDPEAMVQKLLLPALVSVQNRSNLLYQSALQAKSIEEKALYMKYADRYADKVAPLAEAIAKQRQRPQKIIVERINIERGAQAVVGDIR